MYNELLARIYKLKQVNNEDSVKIEEVQQKLELNTYMVQVQQRATLFSWVKGLYPVNNEQLTVKKFVTDL